MSFQQIFWSAYQNGDPETVGYFHPERFCLFGSAARGDGGPDSDLDFCVLLPDDAPAALNHKRRWQL
jgi:predicted nucleotidyltransferase